MQYATTMGELYALTDHNWEKFLTAVAGGMCAGETLIALGKRMGPCRSVTDWTRDDAQVEIDALPKPRMDRRFRRRLFRLSTM